MRNGKTSLARLLAVCTMPVLLVACQGNGQPNQHVPFEYYESSVLQRNQATAVEQTQYLEVNLNPQDSQLRQTEIAKIRGFISAYSDKGHGPLVMSLPKGVVNPQLAVSAAAEARELAWEGGIEYGEIQGSAYDARGRQNAPLIMAFKSYKALAPHCPSKAFVDYADTQSNNDQPSLGCSVRTNLAAMIADPADLFGERDLAAGDPIRRENQLTGYREGTATGAERTDAESGAISTAVN